MTVWQLMTNISEHGENTLGKTRIFSSSNSQLKNHSCASPTDFLWGNEIICQSCWPSEVEGGVLSVLRRYTFRRVYTVHRSSGFDIVSINSSHCLGIHNGFLGEAWIYIIQSFVLKEESFNLFSKDCICI